MTPPVVDRDRGAIVVLGVAAATMIAALITRLILDPGTDGVAWMLIGIPVGALLGWIADLAIPRLVDLYMAAIRRGR